MLQNRFKLRLWDPVLNKGAIWTYWEGAYRDTGRDEGATLVIQTADKKGWCWYIPQHDNTVSVGVVAPFDYLFKGRERLARADLQEEVETAPGVKERLSKATRATGYFARGTIRTARVSAPATAGCWSATRSASSIRCIPPACCSR